MIQYGRGCETFPHTLFQREAIIPADETEKYTDIRVILAQLSGGPGAGTENKKGQGTYSTAKRLQKI